MEYKIRTLKDIFELPLDKMTACLQEVTDGMVQAKLMQEAIRAVASDESSVIWPDESTWIDDDKGEITANVHHDGKFLFGLTTKKSES